MRRNARTVVLGVLGGIALGAVAATPAYATESSRDMDTRDRCMQMMMSNPDMARMCAQMMAADPAMARMCARGMTNA